MAIASVDTLTLLNGWARRMNVPIWHYNQVTGAGVNAPLSTPRQDVWVQDEREYVAEGLSTAIALAVPHLGYWPRPVYLEDTLRLSPQTHHWFLGLRLNYGYIQALGGRADTLIAPSATVVYTPGTPDQQSIATITVPVASGVLASELRVYFRAADRPANFVASVSEVDDRWWIDPLTVTISGGVATIRGHRALFVNPAIWAEPYNAPNYNASAKNRADTGDSADFVSAVAVYRVRPDPAGAVTFLSEPHPDCGPVGASGYIETPGTAWIEQADIGTIGARVVGHCAHHPQFVRVKYLAGLPTINGEIERDLQTALVRLANCEMPQEPTAWSDERLQIWQKDTLIGAINDARTPAEGDSPFGPRLGQVAAWRVISRRSLGRGVSL